MKRGRRILRRPGDMGDGKMYLKSLPLLLGEDENP